MDTENFQSNTSEERRMEEKYNYLSRFMSEKLRELPEKDRVPVLRDLNPTDLSLMNLYLQALKKEDYETCAAARELLLERGFKIPG
ncbi:hypothetical protein [Agriterribacter humi]|uniref:hypothetical protein n=1 Tax=Agriterribacter humi TaxID=1104781 RepID=UPI0012647691|nr:hypothetical protein [Agriterribacter humi]